MDIYEKYIQKHLGKLSVSELNSDIVIQILPRQLSGSIHKSIYSVLNQMLHYGSMHLGIPNIKLNPCTTAKKAEPVEILSFSEQKKLLNYLYSDMDRYKLGVVICLSTGLRLGEIYAMKWEDIDFESKSLYVNRTVQRVSFAWLDTGNHDALLDASDFVAAFQKRQGLYISCIEEIAYKRGFIDKEQLFSLAEPLMRANYGKYLVEVAEGL